MGNYLETMALLIDENERKSIPFAEQLSSFRETVEDKFIPAVEKVNYVNKYKLLDELKEYIEEMQLYLSFPRLIGMSVCAVLTSSKSDRSGLANLSLAGQFKEYKYDCCIAADVPTIIYPDSENDEISAINIAENQISLSKSAYLSAIEMGYKEQMDLGSLIHIIAAPSAEVRVAENKTAYIVIPEKADKGGKYFKALQSMADSVMVCSKITIDELLCFRNLKKVIFAGISPSPEIKSWAKSTGIVIRQSDKIELCNSNSQVNNFEYRYLIENIVYEISSYLAGRKKRYADSVALINSDLLFKDEKTEEMIKGIQKENTEEINSIDSIYQEFIGVSQDLFGLIDEIEEGVRKERNLSEAEYHVNMAEPLLDLIIKMGDTFKQFGGSHFRELIAARREAAISVGANSAAAAILWLDAVAIEPNTEGDEFKLFAAYKTESEFVIRKQIDMAGKMRLSRKECYELVEKLTPPLRAIELRMLADYYFSVNNKSEAKEKWTEAMHAGDELAGNMLLENYTLSEEEIMSMANAGNAEACYRVSADKSKENLKYLTMAAAKGHKAAIQTLGDYYFERFSASHRADAASKAYKVLSIAYSVGQQSTENCEKIAILLFKLEDYKECVEYCKTADTPQSHYLRGVMLERGLGCSSSKKKALKQYEIAARAGHSEASVAYEKLSAKLAAEEERRLASEDDDYSSSSTSSGYYSSGGW